MKLYTAQEEANHQKWERRLSLLPLKLLAFLGIIFLVVCVNLTVKGKLACLAAALH